MVWAIQQSMKGSKFSSFFIFCCFIVLSFFVMSDNLKENRSAFQYNTLMILNTTCLICYDLDQQKILIKKKSPWCSKGHQFFFKNCSQGHV